MLSLVSTRSRLINQLSQYGYIVWHCNMCRRRIMSEALFLAHIKLEHGLADRDYRRILSGKSEGFVREVAQHTLIDPEATSGAS